MPKLKPIEKEEELEIKKKGPKKETFCTRWFKDYATMNQSDLKIVCDLTARAADDQFRMSLPSGNTEVYGIVFYGTFLTILDFLREKEKDYKQFTIEIANSINIGYTNNTDDDNEKVGNFMPVMEHIGINRKYVDEGKPLEEDTTCENFMQWKQLNIKKNIEFYNKIQSIAYDRLVKEFRTDIRFEEGIFPLFCIFMDHIVSILKVKFKEVEKTDVSEVSMNVFGLFDVFYSFNSEDNQEVIEFQPNIRMKLALKNDSKASND